MQLSYICLSNIVIVDWCVLFTCVIGVVHKGLCIVDNTKILEGKISQNPDSLFYSCGSEVGCGNRQRPTVLNGSWYYQTIHMINPTNFLITWLRLQNERSNLAHLTTDRSHLITFGLLAFIHAVMNRPWLLQCLFTAALVPAWAVSITVPTEGDKYSLDPGPSAIEWLQER